MKMKRIANDLALRTLGYLIKGNQEIEVYYCVNGYRKETIFKGCFSDFRKIHFSGAGELLSYNKVVSVDALDSVLQIGIGE